MRLLEVRVNRLGLAKWQQHVKQLMYEYIAHLSWRGIDKVLVVLKKYELMEQLSLLEMAIWKSSICDGLIFSSIEDMRQYVILEENFDVKTYTENLRIVSGCAIIIPLVLEFL